MRLLTRDQAGRDLCPNITSAGPRIAELPPVLHDTVFDMYVNAGANAVRILQRLFNDMRIEVAVDGVIGPQTLRAAETGLGARRPITCATPMASPGAIITTPWPDRRPASRKYARRQDGGKGGWILRAEEFIAPRFHLTEAEHRERTAEWD